VQQVLDPADLGDFVRARFKLVDQVRAWDLTAPPQNAAGDVHVDRALVDLDAPKNDRLNLSCDRYIVERLTWGRA
jgi:hypothetical protein